MNQAYAYQHRVRDMISNQGTPSILRTVGALQLGAPTSLAEREEAGVPVQIGYMLGGLAGAGVVGTGIGYLAGGSGRSAITGALAGAGVWAASSSAMEFTNEHWVLGGALLAAAGVGIGYAWYRKPR